MKKLFATFMAFWVGLAPAVVNADPCGMVPPIYLGAGIPITRIGLQQTYVFYKDGIESIVLRPGFEGKVDQFGMLIPFPSPPAIRKVADDVFAHVAAAVDPPEVVVDLRRNDQLFLGLAMKRRASSALQFADVEEEGEVRVLSEEAVGMYEVAVLDAGSARALKSWMSDHSFRYPDGMDAVCEEYVQSGWCFVAVKARVGSKAASDPRPGQREIDNTLPQGSTFDGHVQAMGFRFRTDELVVPMRLSAFNPGDLRNVVYVLTDQPKQVANMPAKFVRRQIPGWKLYQNLTQPLPLRVLGGSLANIPDWQRQSLPAQRNPVPHNGIARDLFAADLLAVTQGRLQHPLEEREKELLRIGEELGLRGPELDARHAQALAQERERMSERALIYLQDMTLSVIDGDFPRAIIASDNIRFDDYRMAQAENRAQRYDAKHKGPAPVAGGSIHFDGFQGPGGAVPDGNRAGSNPALFLAALLILGLFVLAQHQKVMRKSATVLGATLAFLIVCTTHTAAQEESPEPMVLQCCTRFASSDTPESLYSAANGSGELTERGAAILKLADLTGEAGKSELQRLLEHADSPLVKLWASAALVRRSESMADLGPLILLGNAQGALCRPVAKRVMEILREKEAKLAEVLGPLAVSHRLQQMVLPLVLEWESEEFVSVLLRSDDAQARRLAAGCLATLAVRAREGVREAVVSALAYDAGAERIPWQGGPLFLPSFSWTSAEAKVLFRQLVSWHLHCERQGLAQEMRQVHNNLNSWGLAKAAGYALPNRELDSTRWLLLFGETCGPDELMRLLDEHGLTDGERYRAIVTLVRAGWVDKAE